MGRTGAVHAGVRKGVLGVPNWLTKPLSHYSIGFETHPTRCSFVSSYITMTFANSVQCLNNRIRYQCLSLACFPLDSRILHMTPISTPRTQCHTCILVLTTIPGSIPAFCTVRTSDASKQGVEPIRSGHCMIRDPPWRDTSHTRTDHECVQTNAGSLAV
jgi:hypothetical protein